MKDYMTIYKEWLENPYFDEATKEELRAIEGDENEIKERFYMDLEFGTAGLRGIIGAGINRMNIYTVRRATQGLANYIIKQGGAAKGVAIAFDSRHMSPEFAEEAALTAQVLGSEVVRLYDVGVSGVHRLLAHMDSIMEASVVVAIAGMEGALASVVGGLAECPVIAVPTSVGYGASFGGVAALLSMLNSCASGVSVVNIDNGFGAGYLANMINHMEVKR